MKIVFNGKERQVREGQTLEGLCEELGIKPEGAAAACSGEVVPKGQWKDFALKDGMEIDVFSLVAGG
ncbi:MAG: sulfur carrier protein ThiS [Aeromonadales bacterium]|nr:sulfur carrier protein ThiS [Aeromonadales bacterium]MDY2890586.1 sulfur carrier protein ThiS [Succinivibrio sp.]